MSLSQENKINPNEPINGWLFFFLWFVVGLGTLLGIGREIYEYKDVPLNILSNITIFALSLEIILMLFLASYTIYSFYKRKPNAVAVAYTLIANRALTGIFFLVLVFVLHDESLIKDFIQAYVFVCVWFAYLKFSDKVNRMFPKETREWHLLEKILLAVSVLSLILLLILYLNTNTINTNSNKNMMIDADNLVKTSVETERTQLPLIFEDSEISRDSIALDGKLITHYCTFYNENVYDYDRSLINEIKESHKNDVLDGFASESDEDVRMFYDMMFLDGLYTEYYYYKDQNGNLFYSFSISPEDYKRACKK